MKKNDYSLFNIEVTDTLAGEANYSWVKRYQVRAKSHRGAIQWLSRNHGAGWRQDYNTGDMARYNLKGAAICCFVEYSHDQLEG